MSRREGDTYIEQLAQVTRGAVAVLLPCFVTLSPAFAEEPLPPRPKLVMNVSMPISDFPCSESSRGPEAVPWVGSSAFAQTRDGCGSSAESVSLPPTRQAAEYPEELSFSDRTIGSLSVGEAVGLENETLKFRLNGGGVKLRFRVDF